MARPSFPFRPFVFQLPSAPPAGSGWGPAMTATQLAELLYRVRLWKAEVSASVTLPNFYNSGPPNYSPIDRTDTISGRFPLICGTTFQSHTQAGYVGYGGQSIYSDNPPYGAFGDYWGSNKEAGGVRGGGYIHQVEGIGATSEFEVETGDLPPNPGPQPYQGNSANYTSAELNANNTLTFNCPVAYFDNFYADIQIGVPYASYSYSTAGFFDGKYYVIIRARLQSSYPFVEFNTHWTDDPAWSDGGIAPDPFYNIYTDITGVIGNMTIELPSGDLVFPIKAASLYGSDMTDVSCDITITPVKFWPYADAAGNPLYDELTGEMF
jgi:hypothetical protein